MMLDFHAHVGGSRSRRDDDRAHSMVMRTPATRWQDASPTGNGSIGAMMYGQIRNDIILLNHERLYYPLGRGKLADVSDQAPLLRRLIARGQYEEAAALMPRVHAERGGSPRVSTDPYQPFCDIRLSATTSGPFRHYRRGVDFGTGRVWMQWTDDAGATTRELFVSRASDTVYLRLLGSGPGAVCCRLSLCEHQDQARCWASGEDLQPPVYEHGASAEGRLTFAGRYAGAYAFGAAANAAVTNGRMHAEHGRLVVEGADELLLRVKLFTHDDPDEAIPRLLRELEDEPADFDEAFTEHSALHGELFGRVCLGLGVEKRAANEEMLLAAYDGSPPTPLMQTMFEFGRHLLICSSRPGGWPANLQGVWNGDFAPAWDSDFHTDENIQMNYWQALPGNLRETALPFFEYFEHYLEDYRENARKLFGCRGILVRIAQTTNGVAYPRVWVNWTAGAGWLGQLFYDYYLFTGDREFLAERAVPWLQEVALFYEDFLTEGPDGKLLFCPSVSPENVPAGEGMHLLAMNATMDVAVCREVLNNLCDACELLEIDSDGVRRWRAILARLPDYEINEDGALREWLHPAFKDNYHHRHQSHIYPAFPGVEVTEETRPELHEACRVAVEKRLVIGLASQTGWSLAHMANIYARLGFGNEALECLEILARSCTGVNLLTYHNDWRDMGLSLTGPTHPPFQIDANLGLAAAVLEMLVFSRPGLVKLLPARPDSWTCGRVSGILCRGGVTVDLEWDLGNGRFRAVLTSRRDQDLLLKAPAEARDVSVAPEGMAAACGEPGPSYWRLALPRQKPVRIQAAMG